MDKQFFIRQVAALEAAFRNFKISDNRLSLDVWFQALKDLGEDQMTLAVSKLIATSRYAPTIAEIRQEATATQTTKDWSEGWGALIKAIGLYGYNREQEALDYIRQTDPLAAEITRRLGFVDICLSENQDNIRANFRMAYEKTRDLDSQEKMLPGDLKDAMAALNAKMGLKDPRESELKKLEAKRYLEYGQI